MNHNSEEPTQDLPLSSGRYPGKRPSLEAYLTSPELFAAPESLEHRIKQLKDYVERGYATYQAANGPRKPLHKKKSPQCRVNAMIKPI